LSWRGERWDGRVAEAEVWRKERWRDGPGVVGGRNWRVDGERRGNGDGERLASEWEGDQERLAGVADWVVLAGLGAGIGQDGMGCWGFE
jgi:hypothetical protein